MLKKIIPFLYLIFLFPHVLVYLRYRSMVNTDMKRCSEHHLQDFNGISGLLYLLTFDKAFRALFYYRIGTLSYLIKFFAPPFSTLIVNSHSSIGEGALFVHSFSTIINPESIGKHFRITHNCTVGNSKEGRPIIGDNVTIHAGAIVIGPIVIGNNVIIGAGAVVTKNIPANCIVIGNPAFIIKRDGLKVHQKL